MPIDYEKETERNVERAYNTSQEVICFTFCMAPDFILIRRVYHISMIATKRALGGGRRCLDRLENIKGMFDKSKWPSFPA